MTDPLAAESLMAHIRTLVLTIGPRPTGQAAEQQARAYIRQVLAESGIRSVEEQPFRTRPTIGLAFTIPLGLMLAGNILSLAGRAGVAIGGLTTLASASSFWRLFSGQRHFFEWLEPQVWSANLIARIPPSGPRRQIVVLIGHTDTQKKQSLTEPQAREMMLRATTLWLSLLLINGMAQLVQLTLLKWLARIVQWGSAAALGTTLQQGLAEERHSFVAGANDNATAVACLLDLGSYLHQHPLQHTEIWLAFTGAEEVLCYRNDRRWHHRYTQNLNEASNLRGVFGARSGVSLSCWR